ncbi:MAG: site-specific integrase [Sedimenticola sp.]
MSSDVGQAFKAYGGDMQESITKQLLSVLRKQIEAQPITKPLEVRDTSLKGFILRIQPSGVMSYIVQVGRGKRITLGKANILTVGQARNKATIALGAAADGRDPKEALRVDEGSETPTLRGFVKGQYGEWVNANRKTGGEVVRLIEKNFFDDFGDTRLELITAWNVEKWRKAQLQEGTKTATLNRKLSALKACLSKAVDWDVIEIHPLRKVKLGREDQHAVVRYLSQDEEKRLREALSARDQKMREERSSGNVWREKRGREPMPELSTYGDHLTPMVLLSINTGMRRGEVFGLHWSDIDFNNNSLVVHGYKAKSGKTRHLPLNTEARCVLKSWQKQQSSELDLVFPGRSGKAFNTIKKAWGAILIKANIQNFRWHDLRHHFASKLVMAGVDLNTVRELLGHSDFKLTLRYAHLAPEHKAAAVEKLMEGM